jgi:hypothetical protein
VDEHLGIGGGLEQAAAANEGAAEGVGIGEVAVMGDGETAALELGEQRLHVAQDGLAGRGIADMTDGHVSGQAVDHLAPRERVADQAEPALGMEPLAVEGDDAGGFLAAVLQGVQAERGDGRRIGMAEDAEDAAFLAEPIRFQIQGKRRLGGLRGFLHCNQVPLLPAGTAGGVSSECC